MLKCMTYDNKSHAYLDSIIKFMLIALKMNTVNYKEGK